MRRRLGGLFGAQSDVEFAASDRKVIMNNGTLEATAPSSRNASNRTHVDADELTRTKRELLQAEVRLAKARATIVSAEIDVKVLSARLRALAK
jgi:hypothetical protein